MAVARCCLIHSQRGAGSYEIAWAGRDNLGREVGSGIHLVRFASGDYQTSQKMVLRK